MVGFVVDKELIFYMNRFRKITRVEPKEAFFGSKGSLIFIIPSNTLGKFLRNNKKLLKIVGKKLKEDVKVVEFSSNIKKFVRNMIYPVKPEGMYVNDGVLNISLSSRTDKGKVYGKGKKDFEKLKYVVKKHFDYIDDIKIQ
ncbi:MAG: hypothetical protein ACOCP4_02860 [Candidatus Woesearchaeota archaeon]